MRSDDERLVEAAVSVLAMDALHHLPDAQRHAVISELGPPGEGVGREGLVQQAGVGDVVIRLRGSRTSEIGTRRLSIARDGGRP